MEKMKLPLRFHPYKNGHMSVGSIWGGNTKAVASFVNRLNANIFIQVCNDYSSDQKLIVDLIDTLKLTYGAYKKKCISGKFTVKEIAKIHKITKAILKRIVKREVKTL